MNAGMPLPATQPYRIMTPEIALEDSRSVAGHTSQSELSLSLKREAAASCLTSADVAHNEKVEDALFDLNPVNSRL